MKASQILALSATLIFQAQACARVRIDRYVHDGYGTIQDMQIYDNYNAAKVLPFPINFDARDDENLLQVDGYSVKLKYKDGKHHPYGGRISYPEGSDRDLQGKTQSTYVDGKGRTHDVYCFSDNYSNCGAYTCNV